MKDESSVLLFLGAMDLGQYVWKALNFSHWNFQRTPHTVPSRTAALYSFPENMKVLEIIEFERVRMHYEQRSFVKTVCHVHY